MCSSRTQQCSVCHKYIPNRDFDHHTSVCSAGLPQEHMQVDVDADLLRAQLESEGLSPEEIDQLMVRKVSEEMDRAYAEQIERTLLKESLEAEHQEMRRRTAVPPAPQFTPHDVAEDMEEVHEQPVVHSPVDMHVEDDEDPALTEAIMKSFSEK